MARVIAGMSTSLDGFVADEQGSIERLYPDLEALHGTPYMDDMIEETGSVVMGRKTFEMGDPDWYVGNYEFQVPIFVVTHHPPRVAPKQDERLSFTFVTEGVEAAIEQAKVVADDKAVHVIGGISVARQVLQAGLVDELHMDIMPVLLGHGLRLFEGTELTHLRLQKLHVKEEGIRTSVGFSLHPRDA